MKALTFVVLAVVTEIVLAAPAAVAAAAKCEHSAEVALLCSRVVCSGIAPPVDTNRHCRLAQG
jgi:hypothetical protein